MTSTTVRPDPSPPGGDFVATGTTTRKKADSIYIHDVKIEVVLKNESDSIPGKLILLQILKNIRDTKTANERTDFLDVNSNSTPHDLSGIPNDTLTERFCIENGGPNNEILYMGFRIKSTAPFPSIHKRVIPLFQPSRIYMKLHFGGFKHGVNCINLGFFINKHPQYTDYTSLKLQVFKKIAHGWDHDHNIFDDAKKKEIQRIIEPDRPPQDFRDFRLRSIPVEFIAGVTTANNSHDEKISTTVVMATIPYKFQRLGNAIMDYLAIETSTLENYIPMGMRRNEPDGFFDIVESVVQWKNLHRTIVLNNIPSRRQLEQEPNANGNTLETLLVQVSDVEAIFYDTHNERVYASVNINTLDQAFVDVTNTILSANTFPTFKPTIKKPFLSSSTRSITSKYSNIMNKHRPTNKSPTSSIATSVGDTSRTKPTRPNPRKIPRAIDLTGATQFPQLPTASPTSPPVNHVNVKLSTNATYAQSVHGTFEATPTITQSDVDSSIKSAISKALEEQAHLHAKDLRLASERYAALQERFEKQNQDILQQRSIEREQRREEAIARRLEQESRREEQRQQQQFFQQIQDDAKHQRETMQQLFTMMMNNQLVTGTTTSPLKPSPQRKKSKPSQASSMTPKILDASLGQPPHANNPLPISTVQDMNIDYDESIITGTQSETNNNNNNTDQHPNNDDKSQESTYYSNRSVTPIAEGNEDDFEPDEHQRSPQQIYDDQAHDLASFDYPNDDKDSFTLGQPSRYNVPKF